MFEDINLEYVFRYMESESIVFDKDEFSFQIKSHPSYPSLLSISDTLTFFNINNAAIHTEISEIEFLPDNFIALLKEANNEPQLYFIKKKNGKYFITKDKIVYEIEYSSLKSKWLNLLFLIEKSELVHTKNHTKNRVSKLLPILWLLIFILILFNSTINFSKLIFLIFSSLGILFSIAALKDLFEAKIKMINSFCKITTSTSCASVVSSNKWKIFKTVNFSDLSIVFFISQFLGLLVLFQTRNTQEFFNIQKLLLLASIPIILLSLFYQKFVEKRWCPICLSIVSVILLEIIYLFLLTNISFEVSLNSSILFGFLFLSLVIIWINFKKILTERKTLKEFQLKANRFIRNYEVFKNTLITAKKIAMPQDCITMGNMESNTHICVITNPFCSHCKEVHKIVDDILGKYGDRVGIKMIFKSNFELENKKTKNFFRILMSLYIKNGEEYFRNALSHFFQSENIDEWILLHKMSINKEEVDNIYETMNNWCLENKINFTPNVYVNGYIFPSEFEIENLEFFINDLIEDDFF